MSSGANPASSKRLDMALAATVVLPTESVVLISMSCWKISRASRRVASSSGAAWRDEAIGTSRRIPSQWGM